VLVLWVWVAVAVVGVVILGSAVAPLIGRLGGMHRAALRLQRRQAEATKLEAKAAVLQQNVLEVQQRAEAIQRKIATLAPGSGRK
jgi:hypothetical protein